MEIERKYLLDEDTYNRCLEYYKESLSFQKLTDKYFKKKHSNKWIRIRETSDNCLVTVKHHKVQGNTEINNEIEVPTSKQYLNKILDIFEYFEMSPWFTKEKYKHFFYYFNCEVAFEKVSANNKTLYALEVEFITDNVLNAEEELDYVEATIEDVLDTTLVPTTTSWRELFGLEE